MSPRQWRARNAFPAMEVPSRVREEGWGAGGGVVVQERPPQGRLRSPED